jgi:hypothetical protein
MKTFVEKVRNGGGTRLDPMPEEEKYMDFGGGFEA